MIVFVPNANVIVFVWSTQLKVTVMVCVVYVCRAVTDPRDGKRVALKKMPNVFQNLISAKRVYRELKMLCHFSHDNVGHFHCYIL